MPTYEYTCDKCGKSFEKFQSISSEPFANCPSCDNKTRRSISGGMGVIFKGSGFYTTDYKKKSKGEEKACDSSCATTGACAAVN